MTSKIPLRPLQPMEQTSFSEPQTPLSCGKRQNVSVACTECREKRTKCSGAMPCAKCTAKGCQCIYDPDSDRRRKPCSKSLALRQALLYTVLKLRSGNVNDVRTFLLKIRRLQSDGDAENFLLQESKLFNLG
ncbi:unnamed protein product [Penicillium egyptiacum]|uniref:Zn(2)-C6 fungal-type domain-containing protein n=1 Tax=Penicillium egyptiacum TaxID=1303716 RepID=A0A9W4KHH1_9EURO|nr:unnamed protein product [Penicillium egyptiacum]